MKKIIIGFGIFLVIAGILLFITLFSIQYNKFIDMVIRITKPPKEFNMYGLILETTFQTIRFAPLIFCLIGAVVIFYFKVIAFWVQFMINNIKLWSKDIASFFIELPKAYLYIFLFIILCKFAFTLYNIVTLPIYIDEVGTYYSMTTKGIFYSISTYYSPNNHILHSILTNITTYLPFSQTVNLRLPNLLVSLLSSIVLFYAFAKLFNKKIAIILLAVFSFLFPVLFYSYLSRGYTLFLLAFIICFYSTIRLFTSDNSQFHFKYYFFLIIGTIAGTYTMVSFLYPYLTCISFIFFIFIRNKDYKKIYPLFLSGVLTLIVILTLYSPIFFVEGVNQVINNRWITPIPRLELLHRLIPHFSDTSKFLFPTPLYITFLIILLILLITKKTKTIIFATYCLIIPPFIMLLHSVIYFPRIWIYLTIPFLFLIGWSIKHFKVDKKLTLKNIITVNIVTMVILTIYFNKKIIVYENHNFKIRETAEYLISQNAQHVCCFDHGITASIKYIFEENKKDIMITKSKESYNKNELNKIKANFDYIISFKEFDNKQDFKFIKRFHERICLSKVK